MHLDSTLRRVSRAEGNEAKILGGSPVGIVFILAASLAGCTGAIETGNPSRQGGDRSGPSGGTGGSSVVTGPSACKADQIGISPLRRLTRIEYDNSIKDLLGVDLGLSAHFSEDELAGSFPGNYFTPISESQYGQYATAAASAAFKTVERLSQLLPCASGALTGGNEASCATQFIRQFGRRAYRRTSAYGWNVGCTCERCLDADRTWNSHFPHAQKSRKRIGEFRRVSVKTTSGASF